MGQFFSLKQHWMGGGGVGRGEICLSLLMPYYGTKGFKRDGTVSTVLFEVVGYKEGFSYLW